MYTYLYIVVVTLVQYRVSVHLLNMYVCRVITYSKSKGQSGKVANPARGQLNRDL